jgi:hypothetical protein
VKAAHSHARNTRQASRYNPEHADGKSTRFLSEAELQKNKAEHGERLEDGTFSGMTLTQSIVAQREERESKFKEKWKMMKQGPYPLRTAATNGDGGCCDVDTFLVHA